MSLFYFWGDEDLEPASDGQGWPEETIPAEILAHDHVWESESWTTEYETCVCGMARPRRDWRGGGDE